MLDRVTSAELTGWLEYLKMDDEMKQYQMARAIVMAFKKDDDE